MCCRACGEQSIPAGSVRPVNVYRKVYHDSMIVRQIRGMFVYLEKPFMRRNSGLASKPMPNTLRSHCHSASPRFFGEEWPRL